MNQNRVIFCMKWGQVYGSDYVNVLYSACKKNITGDFRFICFTDDSRNINKSIEIYPIIDIGCTHQMWTSGAWPKLSIFSRDLYGITGRGLFIDLDTVICGSLEKFFTNNPGITVIDTGENWRPGGVTGLPGALVGTGLFEFDIGSQSYILDSFAKDPRAAFNECLIEQVWVQKMATQIKYWPNEWVISFKRWLRQPIGLDLILDPKEPPSGVSVVAFHGIPRPISLVRRGAGFWDRFPHLGNGQVRWMKKYWEENGGAIV